MILKFTKFNYQNPYRLLCGGMFFIFTLCLGLLITLYKYESDSAVLLSLGLCTAFLFITVLLYNLFASFLIITLLRPILFYLEIPINPNLNISLEGFVSIIIIIIGYIYILRNLKIILKLPSFTPLFLFFIYSSFGYLYVEGEAEFLIKLMRIASYLSIYGVLTDTMNSWKRVKTLVVVIILSYCIFFVAGVLQYQRYDIYALEVIGITSKNTFGILTALLSLFLIGMRTTRIKKSMSLLENSLFIMPMILVLIMSYTRTAWLGFISGFFVILLYLRRIKFVISHLVMVSSLLFLLWPLISIGIKDLKEIKLYPKDHYSSSLEGRAFLYFPQAIENWKEKPILGHGLGSTKNLTILAPIVQKPPHNEYLQMLQEVGLIGILFYFYFLWSNFTPLYRGLRSKSLKEGDKLRGVLIGCLAVFLALIVMSITQETFSNGTIGSYYISLVSAGHAAYLLEEKQYNQKKEGS